jgi:hypothetical protein
VIQEQEANML